MLERIDRETHRIDKLLAPGPRLAIIGSASLSHVQSKSTCAHIGRLLAGIHDLILITGGVSGVGQRVGRSFFRARVLGNQYPRVYHLLPEGFATWDYGQTVFGGQDMEERREILGRLSHVYVVVEGGPGTEHEAEVARSRGAIVIPVGRLGGCSARLYADCGRPGSIDTRFWETLGSVDSTPEETADAVMRAVNESLETLP